MKFTGQREDGTGLYYYGARYYDPAIGRFISADPIVPNPANPQALNRYSYVVNNPLRYTDPTGQSHRPEAEWITPFVENPPPGVHVEKSARKLVADIEWQHQQAEKFGRVLVEYDAGTGVTQLAGGSVILVTDERTTIRLPTTTPSGPKETIPTVMTFPLGGGGEHVQRGDIQRGEVPGNNAPGCWTRSASRIVCDIPISKLEIRLLVHESEHVEQRIIAGGLGGGIFNAAYVLSSWLRERLEAAAERAASPPSFWAVVPRWAPL